MLERVLAMTYVCPFVPLSGPFLKFYVRQWFCFCVLFCKPLSKCRPTWDDSGVARTGTQMQTYWAVEWVQWTTNRRMDADFNDTSPRSSTITRCLHFTAGVQSVVQPVGCTIQMSPAKRRLSYPASTLMTPLGWRAARRVWSKLKTGFLLSPRKLSRGIM